MALIAFGLWFVLLNNGWKEVVARNMILFIMVLMENVHVFNCRSEWQSAFRVPLSHNWLLLFGVLGAQSIHIWVMHIPFMQEILQVQPIGVQEWLLCALLAITLLIPMELFKTYKRKQARRLNYV